MDVRDGAVIHPQLILKPDRMDTPPAGASS